MSGVRSLTRRPTIVGFPSAGSAPIYVDSDDNRVKLNPFGSGTTEVILLEAAGANSAEVTTATNVLTAAESGKTLFLNAATEFVTTLPAPALGLRYSVVVTAAPSGADYTVVTDAAAEVIIGKVFSAAGDAGDVENTAGGTTVTFVGGQSVAGDRADFVSDGTNWYVVAFASVAAGITITG
jgi:hypothetical protein